MTHHPALCQACNAVYCVSCLNVEYQEQYLNLTLTTAVEASVSAIFYRNDFCTLVQYVIYLYSTEGLLVRHFHTSRKLGIYLSEEHSFDCMLRYIEQLLDI